MTPGPELDALVAQNVMGWTRRETLMGLRWNKPAGHPLANADAAECPPYSTDIAAAWEVAVKAKLFEYYDFSYCEFKKLWSFGYESALIAEAPTAPLAICLAALKEVAK